MKEETKNELKQLGEVKETENIESTPKKEKFDFDKFASKYKYHNMFTMLAFQALEFIITVCIALIANDWLVPKFSSFKTIIQVGVLIVVITCIVDCVKDIFRFIKYRDELKAARVESESTKGKLLCFGGLIVGVIIYVLLYNFYTTISTGYEKLDTVYKDATYKSEEYAGTDLYDQPKEKSEPLFRTEYETVEEAMEREGKTEYFDSIEDIMPDFLLPDIIDYISGVWTDTVTDTYSINISVEDKLYNGIPFTVFNSNDKEALLILDKDYEIEYVKIEYDYENDMITVSYSDPDADDYFGHETYYRK